GAAWRRWWRAACARRSCLRGGRRTCQSCAGDAPGDPAPDCGHPHSRVRRVITLAGKRILVTGASRGIGKATALMAAMAGADVAVLYHSRRSDGEQVSRAVRAMGRKSYLGGGDLADPGRVSQLMSEVKAALGGLDGVVI